MHFVGTCRSLYDKTKEKHLLADTYKEVWFLFVFSHVTYIASWSSVLCAIVSGITKYPEKMPMAVWISTIGLLVLYQTFVWAQANVIWKRFTEIAKSIHGEKLVTRELYIISSAATLCYRSLTFGEGQTIVLVAMSISSDLILAALYSIKSIRHYFQMPNRSNSEPWCLLVFLYTSSVSTILVFRFVRWLVRYCGCGRCFGWDLIDSLRIPLLLATYVLWSTGWFFVWGHSVMRSLDESQEMWWKAAALGLPIIAGVSWIGINSNRLRGNDDNGDTTSKSDRSIEAFAHEHKAAAICHLCVASFLAIVVNVFGLDFNDGFDTHSFHLNRANISVTTIGPSQVHYCARRNSLPVQRWWCAVTWCLASAAQHWGSYRKLAAVAKPCCAGSSSVDPLPPGWGQNHKGCGAFVVSLLVAYALRERVGCLGAITLTFIISTLILVFMFVAQGAPPSVSAGDSELDALKSTSRSKWTEYALSATLMHVVVNCIGGIVNAHELVLLCGYMVTSMALVSLMDRAMDRLESNVDGYTPSVARVIDYERPFVALSFFAKLALTVAITVPVAFDASSNRWEINLDNLWCP